MRVTWITIPLFWSFMAITIDVCIVWVAGKFQRIIMKVMNDKWCHHTITGRLLWTCYNCIPNEKKESKKQSGECGSYETNGWTLVVKWMLSTLTDMPWGEFPKEVNEYACHSRSWNNYENFCYDITSESRCDNSNQIVNMNRHWNWAKFFLYLLVAFTC